jgi:hypothetical protein
MYFLTMAKRRGRPRKPKREHRSKRLTFGLTSEEFATVAKEARAEGLTPSVWARKMVLRALRQRRKS